jgi:hypothetical protein
MYDKEIKEATIGKELGLPCYIQRVTGSDWI